MADREGMRRTSARADDGPAPYIREAKGTITVWFFVAVLLILAASTDIMALRFPDPDDAMRLLEVRDWLAGQSWWNVGQHRFNGGNFPMHWSRLVDLPLGAIIAVTQPLVGAEHGARVAMILVPLLLLLTVMMLLAYITRRVAGREASRLSVLLVPMAIPLLAQVRPMRIDHHGWQIVLTVAAAAFLVAVPRIRTGFASGLALAWLLTISLEGMPMAAAVVGVAAMAWAWDPSRRAFLLSLTWTLFVGAVVLHVVTRGPGIFAPACDAISLAWLATLGIAALGITGATILRPAMFAGRIVALGAAAAATATTSLALSTDCLAGPFGTLPPVAYRIWYLNVLEGRPLWEQPVSHALMVAALPAVDLFATVREWRNAHGDQRFVWAMLLGLLVAASGVMLFVERAGATANALAIPGAAALLLALLTRARTIPTVGRRTVATAAAFLAVSPAYIALAGAAIASRVDPAVQKRAALRESRQICRELYDIRTIGTLPRGIVFTPLDVAPDLIATTHHRGVGSGYHRSPTVIATVIQAFTGSPERAREIVMASGASYLAGCPGLSETEIYRRDFPEGFWARLQAGERFDWLEPVETGTPALAWRVIRPLPPVARRP
ncbi:hypothetical protein CA236_14395 [Sphingomonas sp. ABOLG]|nr:hypothetical protein CA236_14395 [Sphingomonas sp. ABOLG]